MSQKRKKNLEKVDQSQKIYLVLYLTVVRVNKYCTIYYTKICTVYKEKWTYLNHFVFHLPKKKPELTQKNRLRLQLKNISSDRLRLCNTAFYSRTECLCRRHIKIPQHVEVKHNTFEVADLQKLIKKTTNDLEVRQSADFTTCVCFLRAEAHCFVKK